MELRAGELEILNLKVSPALTLGELTPFRRSVSRARPERDEALETRVSERWRMFWCRAN